MDYTRLYIRCRNHLTRLRVFPQDEKEFDSAFSIRCRVPLTRVHVFPQDEKEFHLGPLSFVASI